MFAQPFPMNDTVNKKLFSVGFELTGSMELIFVVAYMAPVIQDAFFYRNDVNTTEVLKSLNILGATQILKITPKICSITQNTIMGSM